MYLSIYLSVRPSVRPSIHPMYLCIPTTELLQSSLYIYIYTCQISDINCTSQSPSSECTRKQEIVENTDMQTSLPKALLKNIRFPKTEPFSLNNLSEGATPFTFQPLIRPCWSGGSSFRPTQPWAAQHPDSSK